MFEGLLCFSKNYIQNYINKIPASVVFEPTVDIMLNISKLAFIYFRKCGWWLYKYL